MSKKQNLAQLVNRKIKKGKKIKKNWVENCLIIKVLKQKGDKLT